MPADKHLKAFVIQRAGSRCEYCTVHQDHDRMLRFPVDRIIAGQHGGDYTRENTALACPLCNGKKGPNIASVDPGTTEPILPLFNPRADKWSDHFQFNGPYIVGLTPTGRATAALLNMNADRRIDLRKDKGYGTTELNQ